MRRKSIANKLWDQAPFILVAILLTLALYGALWLAVDKAIPQQLAESAEAAKQVPEHIRLMNRE